MMYLVFNDAKAKITNVYMRTVVENSNMCQENISIKGDQVHI